MTDRYEKYDQLKIDRPAERVLRITFDNPKTYNSINSQTHTQITNIWRDVDADPDINVVIVTGEGRAFSSGGDFDWIDRMTTDQRELQRVWKEAKDLVYNIINCNKIMISAINGPAAGAGLVVGILADISIAGKSAKIVDGHPRLGVAAGDVAAIIWPMLCGMAKAKLYLLSGKPINGEEADRIGLVSQCVEDDALQQTALDLAQELAQGSQSALRWTKYSLNNWLRQAGPIFDTSTALEMLGFLGSDAREGLISHKEKRPPNFDPNSPV